MSEVSEQIIGEPKYMKHILLNIKEKNESSTRAVRDFNTWHQRTDHPDRKQRLVLNNSLDQTNLIDTCH